MTDSVVLLFFSNYQECMNVETQKTGFCCRDPLYEDPWPANMPMPNMPKNGVHAG